MNSVTQAEEPTMILPRITEYEGRHWAPMVSVDDYLRFESPYRPHVPRHAAPEDGAR